jgi:hypothetical protein
MNLVESDFTSFVESKCKMGEFFKYGALDAEVIKTSNGYCVAVYDDHIHVTLASIRKDVRRFASIDAAGKFLKSIGFRSFMVNLI